jgi:peptidyl-prolyl cis-trans isomerase SurA
MKKLILFLISFFAFSASFAATPQKNFIIARVNKKAITHSELLDRYRFVIAVSKMKITEAQDKELLTRQILDKMIDEELIRQEAATLKIEVTPEEITESIDILAAQQKKNVAQFKFFFTNKGLSFDNYLQQIESEILWSKIISELLRSKVKVTEVEIKEFFEQRKFNTNIKKFLISEILILPSQNSEQLAEKLVQELRQGADFKNIVRQFSASLSVENSGEIGWVSQADIDQKIFNAISSLKKDSYSEAIKMADGYRIFKLLDVKIETHIAEQDLTAARNAIFSKKLQTLAKGYAMDLRKKAFVEIAQEEL